VRTAQGTDQTAQTRDVSANGVFLYSKSRMEKGTDVELVLILPPELTPAKSVGYAARPPSSGSKKQDGIWRGGPDPPHGHPPEAAS